MRYLYKNNLLILCEGSETEPLYFEEIKQYVNKNAPGRFSGIRIIPLSSEIICQDDKSTSRPKRKLFPDRKEYRYYIKSETCKENYERYAAQPLRYVREAQLFIEEDGYEEAWVVFDDDNFPKKKEAFDLADENKQLHIAFSSMSFEEWILLHFERNTKAFQYSVCKIDDEKGKKVDMMCGTGRNVSDCHGTKCIGGYLREKQYIPNYEKKNGKLFSDVTLKNIPTCFINAAWSRCLSDESIYKKNPVTTVDELVKKLLDYGEEFVWHSLGEAFRAYGSEVQVAEKDENAIVSNNGDRTIVLIAAVCQDARIPEEKEYFKFPIEINQCHSIVLLDDSNILVIQDIKTYHFVRLR